MARTTTDTTASDSPTTLFDGSDDRTGRAGLRQAFVSELTKIRTVRPTVWTLAAMAVATVGIAVLVAATGSLQDDDTILGGALGNSVPGQLDAAFNGPAVFVGQRRR